MNYINNAMSHGYEAGQVLDYLIRHFPESSRQIRLALKKGYTAKEIVKFIGNKKTDRLVNKKIDHYSEMTEHEKTRLSDKEKKRNVKKNVAKGAVAAATLAGGLYRAYQMAKGASRVFPEVLPALQQSQEQKPNVEIDLTPRIAHQPKLIFNQQNIPQLGFDKPPPTPQSPISPLPAPIQPQPENPNPLSPIPQQPSPIPDNANKGKFGKDILDNLFSNLNIKDSIDKTSIDSNPNTVKTLARFILGKSKVKKVEKEYKTNFDELVDEYLSYGSTPTQQQPKSEQSQVIPKNTSYSEPPEFPSITSNEPKVESQKQEGLNQKLANEGTGNIVALPDGTIGKTLEVKQGIAKIETKKGVRRKKEQEIIKSPLPEKELYELYDDLIQGIEKETGSEVSRMVEWAGYDPDTNELAFIPHLGGLYVYDNISPEDSEKLTNILSTRKSTGKNHIGVWKKGTKSPIGAEMSKLIRKLQQERGGKGKEYKGKFDKIYDAIEPAKLASKENYEREKRKTKKPRSS